MTHDSIYRTLALLGIAFTAIVAITRIAGNDIEPALHAAKSGVVLDAATGKPVAGAYVAVRWLEESRQMALFGGSVRGQCVNRVVVRTDADGRYDIPAARFPLNSSLMSGVRTRYFWDLYTYAPGYAGHAALAHPRSVVNPSSTQAVIEPVLLGAESDALQQRLSTLADTLAHFTCHPFAHDAGSIEQSIAAEAAAAACLPGAHNSDESCAMFRHASAQVP